MLNECPSRFSLVQFLAEDIPDDERRRIAEHAGGCRECQEMIESIELNVCDYQADLGDHFSALKDSLPPNVMPMPPFDEERKTSSLVIRRALKVLVPLAAAAAIAFLLLPGIWESVSQSPTVSPQSETPQSTIRYKGQLTTFEVVAKRGENQFKVVPGTVLLPGDSIRFVISTESKGYISVMSIDARQRISPFYPETEPSSDPSPMAVNEAGRQELPGSVILDDAVGNEYLIVVFSETAFSRIDLFRDLEKMGVDKLPDLGRRHNLQARSLKIIKKPR